MKFGIYRHESSIGNSIEHIYALSFYLLNNSIDPSKIQVYVQHSWQKDFVCCIDGIKEENVKLFSKPVTLADAEEYSDIHMPCVYGGPGNFSKTFDSNWDYLNKQDIKRSTLKFNSDKYKNKFDLPKNSIVLFCREQTQWHSEQKREELEEHRFVKKPQVFHELAHYYKTLGFKVVRIGDQYQQKLPGNYEECEYGEKYEDANIIDLTKFVDYSGRPLWDMQDYLYVLQNCKLFISCDAGIWPMAAAMKKNMVFCNAAPCRPDGSDLEFIRVPDGTQILKEKKPKYSHWLPQETTRILLKKVLKVPGRGVYIFDTPIQSIKEKSRELINV